MIKSLPGFVTSNIYMVCRYLEQQNQNRSLKGERFCSPQGSRILSLSEVCQLWTNMFAGLIHAPKKPPLEDMLDCIAEIYIKYDNATTLIIASTLGTEWLLTFSKVPR
jgi:hypothetical protein